MSRDQLDQEGSQENRPKDRQRRKSERNRPGMVSGGAKVDQSGQGSQGDHLDDPGRRRHMGHGDERDEQAGSPAVEEGLGRPVWVDRGRKEPAGEWDDKTEGTSRKESDPTR